MSRFSPRNTHQILTFEWYYNFDTIIDVDYWYHAFTYKPLQHWDLPSSSLCWNAGTWGYNTPRERDEATTISRIHTLELPDFCAKLKWYPPGDWKFPNWFDIHSSNLWWYLGSWIWPRLFRNLILCWVLISTKGKRRIPLIDAWTLITSIIYTYKVLLFVAVMWLASHLWFSWSIPS